MKGSKYFIKYLAIGAIFLLMMPALQGSINNTENLIIDATKENDIIESQGTTHYEDCIIVIWGRCNRVWGALTWLFGFYCPLLKKNLFIQASGMGNESLNAMVRGDGVGTYFDQENIHIELRGATGVMYWFSKSLFFTGNQLFARCKAENCWITTP
jgi:hypothetical protein